jgi:site-specific DNA-methyltransferase (adenine-specific)
MPLMNKGMYSSETDLWSTPQKLFDDLNQEFNFTLDPCATIENAKCKTFYTIDDDGLSMTWTGNVFMNPPYGRDISKWISKAYYSSLNGALCVCLIPARTDTAWWHDYVMKSDEIRFIRGRLKFGDGKGGAPFPSAIVIFRGLDSETHIKNGVRVVCGEKMV